MKHRRRHFLRSAGLVSLAAAAPPAFLSRAAASPGATDRDSRVLVVLQLAGGNDGLNTVVPFADDAYRRARPGIALPEAGLHKLEDGVGLHPALGGLKGLHDEGALAVVHSVGYRSHFRSMDIWNSALPGVEIPRDGWLGRALDLRAGADPGAVPALAVGTGALPLALVGRTVNVPTVSDLNAYRLQPGPAGDKVRAALQAADAGGDDQLAFLRRASASAARSAARIEEIATDYKPASEYPATRLAGQLKTVAQLVAGELGARIFFVSLGGFDTHSDQLGAHAALMAELGGAVSAFFADLRGQGLADRVLLATYSEFGRRVNENGSLGTDHGTAAPLFLASPALTAPGLHGAPPSLTDLDANGDLKFATDFRSVYATLLERWLGFDSEPVLGSKFEPLSVV